MRRPRLFIRVVAVLLLAVGSALIYLAFGDLGWIGVRLTALASDGMNRPLVIEGSFEADLLSSSPRVVATEVALGDPDGDLSPGMVQVDRLEGNISFSSLYSLPVRIEDLHIQGGLVRLGPTADGRPNWHFGGGNGPTGETKSENFLPVTFGTALLESVTLRYESLRGAGPIVLEIDRLELEPHGTREHRIDVTGHLRGRPFEVSGTTTRLEELIFLRRPSDLDLKAALADATGTVLGSVGRIWALVDPELRVELAGPEIEQLTEIWDLPSLGSGPFEASARTSTQTEGIRVAVDADLNDLQARAEGTLDDLLKPRRIAVEVEASGLDLAASGALIGVDSLPEGPFDVSGALRIDQGRVSFRHFEALAAEIRVEIDGDLGPAPGFVGTDLQFSTSGPSLGPFENLAGTSLPAGAFEAQGRLLWREEALEFDGVDFQVGHTTGGIRGTLGAPPDRLGTDLELKVSGESLEALDLPVAGLANRPFDASARIKSDGEVFRIEGGDLRIGEDSMGIKGTLDPASPHLGARLEIRASGPDLRATGDLLGLPELPSQPWDLEGGLEIGASDVTLRSTTFRSSGDSATFAGRIGMSTGLVGTDLEVSASGSDASRIRPELFGIELPPTSWEVSGRLRRVSEGLDLEGVRAKIGEVSGRVSGRVALGRATSSTHLDVAVQGDDLSAVEGWFGLPILPAEPFTLEGGLVFEEERIRLAAVEATLGANRLHVEGDLPRDLEMPGAGFDVEGSGPDLAELIRDAAAARLIDAELTPAAEPAFDRSWQLDGRIQRRQGGYDLESLDFRLGEGSLKAEGFVGGSPGFLGTDLHLSIHGSNAAIPASLAGIWFPPEAYEIETRIRRREGTTTFDTLEVHLGSSHVSLTGTLGDPPRFEGSSLVLQAKGQRLMKLRGLAHHTLPEEARKHFEPLKDLPFEISVRLQGSLDSFDVDALRASLGQSDVAGSLSLDRRGTLALRGQLTSDRIHLPELLGVTTRKGKDHTESPVRDRLIPDLPVALEWLPGADGDLRLEVGDLVTPWTRLQEAAIEARLEDGRLTLDPFAAKGPALGRISGRLILRQTGDALDLETSLDVENLPLVQLVSAEDRSSAIPLDLELQLETSGSSLHDLALSASGRLRSRLRGGLIDHRIVEDMLPNFLLEIVDMVSPGQGGEDSYRLECGYLILTLDGGFAKLDPLVLQGARTTILGDGQVRFSDEALDLRWTVKPRKGVGLNTAAATANPYFKVGGTLAHPEMELKPIEATISAGAAVATSGVSILARRLWDRVTADRKVCKKARKELERVSNN